MSKIDKIIDILNSHTFFNDESDYDELGEQDAPAADSGGGGGKPGYPTVTKWESGATRGPANQIGLTKLADIVKINRGKANNLL